MQAVDKFFGPEKHYLKDPPEWNRGSKFEEKRNIDAVPFIDVPKLRERGTVTQS